MFLQPGLEQIYCLTYAYSGQPRYPSSRDEYREIKLDNEIVILRLELLIKLRFDMVIRFRNRRFLMHYSMKIHEGISWSQ